MDVSGVMTALRGRSILHSERPQFWRCEHKDSEIRLRISSNGARCFFRQCLRCGRAIEAISGSAAPKAAPQWDHALEDVFRKEVQRREAAWEETRNREWWAWYNEYLKTPEWRDRAERVMRRAGRICEGCCQRPAVQVHHTTYEHVGDELLWELRAICLQCHHRAHPEKDADR